MFICSPSDFKGKEFVVVGLGTSAGDVVPAVVAYASKVYISHRRGAAIFKRLGSGTPADLTVTRRRRQIGFFLQRWDPGLATWAAEKGGQMLMRKSWGEDGLDPSWRLAPAPNILLTLPASAEDVVTFLQQEKVTSVHGVRRFTDPSLIEMWLSKIDI
jgi:dimethylaniline monooxygenase (N-oxide forming)